eukprot:2222140-Pleurochrysis_carterae.AAC.1
MLIRRARGSDHFFDGTVPEGALKANTFTNTVHIAADTNNEVGVAGTAGGVNGRSGVLLMHLTVFGRIGNGGFADVRLTFATMCLLNSYT